MGRKLFIKSFLPRAPSFRNICEKGGYLLLNYFSSIKVLSLKRSLANMHGCDIIISTKALLNTEQQ